MSADRQRKPTETRPEDEEWVPEDDTVIGTAFRWSMLVIGVLLVGALVTVYDRTDVPQVRSDIQTEIPETVQQRATIPAVTFSDVTQAAGIDFVHSSGARGEKLIPETMGSGAAFFDYDNDGAPDLLLVNSQDAPLPRPEVSNDATLPE